jgi:hypothetical protein
MPDYYIKMDETKEEKDHKGRITVLYCCSCKICEKCWFNPLSGYCIYGGPYSGYEDVDDRRTISKEI